MGEIITIRTILVAAFALFLVFLFTSFVSAQNCVSPPEGIVAWWPLDEQNGTGVQEIIGNNNGIHVNGPLRQSNGKVGNALLFDGINDYVAVQDNDLWTFGSRNFTIEMWVNFTAPWSGSRGHPGDIFIAHDEGAWWVNKWFFALGEAALWWTLNSPTIGPQFLSAAPFAPVVGQWYHIAVRRGGNNYTIFVNGVPTGSQIANFVIPNANSPLTIGQGEGLGYMDGLIDEISIYYRDLTNEEINSIVAAGSAGKCKVFSITTPSPLGGIVGQQLTYVMQTRFGTWPFTWSVVSGNLPGGLTLHQDGIIDGTPTEGGNFPLVIRVVDVNNTIAEKMLTFEILMTIPPSDLRIHKVGTTAVPGRAVDYFIAIENAGILPTSNFKIFEILFPYYSYRISSPTATQQNINITVNTTEFENYLFENYNLTLGELNISRDPYLEVNISALMWDVSSLDPQEIRLFHYGVDLYPGTPVNSVVFGQACTQQQEREGVISCLQKPFTAVVCAIAMKTCDKCARSGGIGPTRVKNCIACSASGPICTVSFLTCMDRIHEKCATDRRNVSASHDPNEKEALANKFIQSNQTLPYVIHFENIGNADAQNIFVNDELENDLNVSTAMAFNATNSFVPLRNLQTVTLLEANKSRMINISIGNQTIIINRTHIEQWNVTLNGRNITWALYNIYLEPNATDRVIYSLDPVKNLPSGTEIRNKATIQFEIFEPITTNETLNIIDDVRPNCGVQPLPLETRNLTFAIFWNGSDPVGEIENYNIFVSENSGAYRSFVNNTLTTNATFTGAQGRTYGFVCIAKDTAGNIEVQSTPGPEAFTRIPGADLQVIGVPRIGTTINFSVFDWAHPGNKYVLALSMGTSPGIPLGDGRVIPLNPDMLFLLSLQSGQLIGLRDYVGFMNEQGQGTSYWDIPNIPELNGVTLYAAFVVLDHTLPIPFASISNAVPITVQA